MEALVVNPVAEVVAGLWGWRRKRRTRGIRVFIWKGKESDINKR